MKILNLTKYDFWGAGLAAKSIHNLLLKNGFDSTIIVDQAQNPQENIIGLHRYPDAKSFFYYFKMARIFWINMLHQFKYGKADPKYCFYNFGETTQHNIAESILQTAGFIPDVIILHWISDFVNAKTIEELQRITKAQIVWILMDNAAFTGGCHFSWNCKGFTSNCSACPAFKSGRGKLLAQRNLCFKKEHLPESISAIVWSKSDYSRISQSSIFKNMRLYNLMIPVDEAVFTPGDSATARSEWNIENSKKVILFGAVSPKEERKGFIHLKDTLNELYKIVVENRLNPDDFVILVAGKQNSNYFQSIPFQLIHTGFLNQNQLIAAYRAADVFVSTSIEDSGPTMINQAMMCGLPVVAFKIGGAIDLIEDRNTGHLSDIADNYSMAEGMFKILTGNTNEVSERRKACAETACQLVSEHTFISSFRSIISE
jgi:glycosyltransferase involved in cell wall biosynthesis